MDQTYGKLIAEFDTKLSNVLLHRFLTLPVLASLAFFAGFMYLWINDDTAANAMIWRILLFLGIAVLVIIYGLFFRKTYKAEVYERGLILTDKRSRKARSISFDQIMNVRDILWTHRYGLISFFKKRELEIHIKNEKRVISINGKSMMNIKTFSSALNDAFNTYRGGRG